MYVFGLGAGPLRAFGDAAEDLDGLTGWWYLLLRWHTQKGRYEISLEIQNLEVFFFSQK